MIYDEAEYPDRISDYSKGFTTDQLDNYWTTQKANNLINSKIGLASTNRDLTATTPPIMPYGTPLKPPSPALASNESLTGFKEALPLRQSDSFHSVNSNLGGLAPPSDHSLRIPGVGTNQHRHQGRFQTPRFNFIWHSAGQAPTGSPPDPITNQLHNNSVTTTTHITKEENTHAHHNRSGSGGNIASTWSKLNWKNRSPQSAHARESAIDDSSDDSLRPPQLPTPGDSPASSGGRRMSRLLSRSGILKFPSYEEKC